MKTETKPKTEKYGKWKPKQKLKTEKPKLIWFGLVFGLICPPLPGLIRTRVGRSVARVYKVVFSLNESVSRDSNKCSHPYKFVIHLPVQSIIHWYKIIMIVEAAFFC